ncbi:hypothetical protein MG293_012101 [Ovis ammon polii]|uniref:Uncharacterized protein n=1 Tax=Ovis ammon polii TaxID=230172 RepID=A0AAD4Y7H9_OVIAM|nr:hypothetical protein MG293_012101 [Ovis ammon polii]
MQMRNEPEKYQKRFKGAGDRNPRSVGEGMAGREHRSGAYDNVIVPDVITSLNENRKSFAFKKRLPDVRWFDYIIIESKGNLGDTATEVQREKIQLDCGGPTILSEIETIYLFRMYYFSRSRLSMQMNSDFKVLIDQVQFYFSKSVFLENFSVKSEIRGKATAWKPAVCGHQWEESVDEMCKGESIGQEAVQTDRGPGSAPARCKMKREWKPSSKPGGQFQSLPVMQTAGAQVQKEREDQLVTPVMVLAIGDLEQVPQTLKFLSFLFHTSKVRILIVVLQVCDECELGLKQIQLLEDNSVFGAWIWSYNNKTLGIKALLKTVLYDLPSFFPTFYQVALDCEIVTIQHSLVVTELCYLQGSLRCSYPGPASHEKQALCQVLEFRDEEYAVFVPGDLYSFNIF